MTITISPIGFLIFLTLISIASNVYFILRVNYLIQHPFGEIADVPVEHVETESDFAYYDAEKEERNQQFNDRIMKIKNELAMQQAVRENESTVAEETHPLVKNLPHNTISTKRVPDVEYAE